VTPDWLLNDDPDPIERLIDDLAHHCRRVRDAIVDETAYLTCLSGACQGPKRSRVTASACASMTSGACGSIPARRRTSGPSTNIVGAAPVRM
jgi:hypothetical protein